MPTYRIKAEARTPRKKVGYKKSIMEFSANSGDAQQVTLTPTDARNWLDHTWYHFKMGWSRLSNNSIWKGHVLDQVRLVLEEVDGGNATVIKTTADDWETMAVSSGSAKN